jgi:hypothetical protein
MNTDQTIIGLVGFIGSGKDTVADYLVNCYNFRRESFANSLKDAVATIFSWDRTLLEGRSKQSREWRDQVDTWWAERLNMPDLTPRLMLQLWGTEVCRNGFHNEIWIASLENRIRQSTDSVVITDCRFPNEIEAIRRLGGKVVRVLRGPEPEWYQDVLNYNTGPKKIGWAISKVKLEKLNIHPSETSWIGTNFDFVIENNGTLDELYQQVKLALPESIR